MALNPLMLDMLMRYMKLGCRVASMGYPDIISPPEHYEPFISDKVAQLEYLDDQEQVCLRHGLVNRPIPKAHSFFDLAGMSLDVFDIVEERGEILMDLNYEIRPEFKEKYDLVLDVGTIEHCFNIAQAVINMASLLKIGGVILHENPFLMCNHGFYSPQPTFYEDFYVENGFEILDVMVVTGTSQMEKVVFQVPRVKRFTLKSYTDPSTIFAMAKRKEIRPFVFPTQTKYKKLLATKPAVEATDGSAADLRA